MRDILGEEHTDGLSKQTLLTFIEKFLQPELETQQVAIAFPEVVLEKEAVHPGHGF